MEIENYNPYSWHKDEYPYAVKVPDAAKNEIVSWREESNVDLLYIFRTVYFKTEQDALFFLLRWS